MDKKWNIGWGPTKECNMRCQFCYSEEVRKDEEVVQYNDWIKFVDENWKKISSINYGTGENSLSDDWFKLILYIYKMYNIPQALTTNGYISQRVQNKELDRVFASAISEVDISLDFADRSRHNKFRGQENAYDWAVNAIEYCSYKNVKTTIVFIGTNETLEESNLVGLFKIASKYNAKLRMNIYRPTTADIKIRKRFIADYKKILDALYFINKRYKILSISDPLFCSILSKDKFSCDPSGSDSLRILADGSMTPSTYLISRNFRSANIRERNVLSKFEKEQYFANMPIPDACENCKFSSNCRGGVFDRRYLWYHNFNVQDPYCPLRTENYMPNFIVQQSNEKVESIHEGYLPTMFFSN